MFAACPFSCQALALSAPSVTIYVIGDVPYIDMEKCLLPFELDKLTTVEEGVGGRLMVHLGDKRSRW